MPRRVQDIVPNDRRSIRDVPVSKEKLSPTSLRSVGDRKVTRRRDEVTVKIHKVEEKIEVDEVEDVVESEKIGKNGLRRMTMTPPSPKKRSARRKGIWLIGTLGVVVLVVVAAFVASTYFSRAVFVITPKVIPVTVNNPLVIKPDVTTDISYQVITMKSKDSESVVAKSGAAVSVKAEGSVSMYNSFSVNSVRLIAGTRIANDSGKVYRLKSSIVIPGYTKPSGSIIPGTVSTAVIADQVGSEYNISRSDSISDFKVVAYKGTAKYDGVYARLKSDLTGGAAGVKKIVDATVLSTSVTSLKSKLLASLLAQARAAVPEGYIMYDNAYTVTYSAPVIGGTDPSSATVTLSGTVYGIIFDRTKLVSKLSGSQAVATFGNLGFTASGLEGLSFNITNLKDFAPEKKGTLILNIKGDMKLIGTIPVDALKKGLAGKSLSESQTVLKSFAPVIENADGELVPPWSKIPSDTSRIMINVKGE